MPLYLLEDYITIIVTLQLQLKIQYASVNPIENHC